MLSATNLLYLCYKKIWIESNLLTLKIKFIYKICNYNKIVKCILHQMMRNIKIDV